MLTIAHASNSDIPALQDLALRQTVRLNALDPRLPESALFPAWALLPGGGMSWLAHDGRGTLVGALSAEPEFWPPESPFANVFPQRYLRLRPYLAAVGDPAPVLAALLDRVTAWYPSREVDGFMLLLPNCDSALNAALAGLGFAPYHVLAHRLMPDRPQPPAPEDGVRLATARDVPAVAALMAESWRFHAAHQPAITISDWLISGCLQQTEEMLGDGLNHGLLVAEAAGAIVGFFALGISAQNPASRPPLFATGRYGDIYEVAVRGDQRRRGIGSAMYAAALRWFELRGADAMFVNYAPTNPISSRFWPGLGFVDTWTNWWRS